jgi:transposase
LHFVKLDQREATSKTRADCGHRLAELPLDVRGWDCPDCGEHHHRDVNAALNIRRHGIAAPGGLRKSVHATAAAFAGGSLRLSAWASNHTMGTAIATG